MASKKTAEIFKDFTSRLRESLGEGLGNEDKQVIDKMINDFFSETIHSGELDRIEQSVEQHMKKVWKD